MSNVMRHPRKNARWTTEVFTPGIWKKIASKNINRAGLWILPKNIPQNSVVQISLNPDGSDGTSFSTNSGNTSLHYLLKFPVGTGDVFCTTGSPIGLTICEETYDYDE